MKNQLAIAASILNKVRLPKISNEVVQLQEESMKQDPDVRIITNCINRNPRLFTKFLAVASFISKKEVNTARQAVDILGTKGVFTVFFSSAIEFSFQANPEHEIIINHAIKIATAMSELSLSVKDVKSGDAYLYGLLYNIGYVVLNQYQAEQGKQCYLTSLVAPSLSHDKEIDAFGTSSHCISVYIAKKWRVRNAIYAGILFQHQGVPKCPSGNSQAYELIHMLNIARMIVAEAEDANYVSEEIRTRASESMNQLGINQRTYIGAQKKVMRQTKDLNSFPDDFVPQSNSKSETA